MVCKDCEKKLGKLAVPDKWKMGARNTMESGGRVMGTHKLLSAKNRSQPYSNACKLCKSKVHQQGAHYCQSCAYKKGLCSMCGKTILDTSRYKMSLT